MIQLMRRINGCKKMEQRNRDIEGEVQQVDGYKETGGRNRETVDTEETDPSTGSKRLDPQYQ